MTVPKYWQKTRLGEKCSIEIGGTPSRNVPDYWDDMKSTSNLWVSIRDLNGGLITETAEHISDAGVKHSNVKLQPEGTILLSFKLSIGRAGIAGLPLYTNEAIAGIRSNVISNEYLFYGLQQWNLYQGVDQAIKGVTLNKEKLKKIEIEFPESLDEQDCIVRVLSAMDAAIRYQERALAKSQKIQTGLLQDFLTRGIDEKGVVRSAKKSAFVMSELGLIPENWRVVTLGELFEQRVQPGRVGLPVMSIVMNEGLVERSSVDRRVESALPPEGHALVIKDDIAYNMMRMWQGVLGRASIDCLVSPAYVVLKPKSGTSSSFAEWLFRDKTTILKFRRASRGVVDDRLRLYPRDFFTIKVAVPESLEEQNFIASMLDAFRLKHNQESHVLDIWRRLRAGLMQDLLTGIKRVTVVLDQESRREKAYA